MKPAILLLIAALAVSAQDAKTSIVEGSVVNSVTGAGIEGATIQLLPTHFGKDTNQYRAVTDANGAFRIAGVKPGDYTQPFAQKTGFFNVSSPMFSGAAIHVAAGADLSGLRIELAPPGRVRGRVLDADGKPVPNVEVALGPGYTNYVTTNADGVFVLENVAAGKFSLMTRANHLRTYFPGTLDPALAEPITVLPGADQGGYEIHLQSAVTHRVRGVVLNPAGKPEPKAVVEIIPGSGEAAPEGSGLLLVLEGTTAFSIGTSGHGVQPERDDPVVTRGDGTFEFPAVREGDWIFRVESNDLVHGAAAVAVRKDLDDLRIRLEAPFEMTAAVTLSDGSPPPQRPALVPRLISLDGLPSLGGTARKDGTWHFANVAPGRYLVQTPALIGSYYVTSSLVGTIDAMRQPVWLNSASPPIRIVVKPGGTIAGTVEKGEGASVLLAPESFAPGDMGWLRSCGAGGSFELTGLPPGEYAAIAVNRIDLEKLTSLHDADTLRTILRDATAVRVDEGAVASLQLKPPIDLP